MWMAVVWLGLFVGTLAVGPESVLVHEVALGNPFPMVGCLAISFFYCVTKLHNQGKLCENTLTMDDAVENVY